MRFRAAYPILFLGVYLLGPASPSRAAERSSTDVPLFVDSRGSIILSNPANRAYKLINGFPEYVIGRGDILEIITFQAHGRESERVSVYPDGTISPSLLTSVPAAGLTPSELGQLLTMALSRYLRNPQVRVDVKEYLSKHIYVLGAINRAAVCLPGTRMGPGVYPLKGRISVLEQILQAGGPSPGGRLSRVRIIRGGLAYLLDLHRMVAPGDGSQNGILQHGDALLVPAIARMLSFQ